MTAPLSDLEITRLTATAMGFEFNDGDADCLMVAPTVADMKAAAAPFPIERIVYSWFRWNPLEDDAQAMALVKRFELSIYQHQGIATVAAYKYDGHRQDRPVADLNRAICLCCAQMERGKS